MGQLGRLFRARPAPGSDIGFPRLRKLVKAAPRMIDDVCRVQNYTESKKTLHRFYTITQQRELHYV